jgi:uncharacterized glyoxalase superfamily protein PhnB
MKLGYTILYVVDVASSLSFYERAFGFKRRFLHESGTYGELETGEQRFHLLHMNWPMAISQVAMSAPMNQKHHSGWKSAW